MCTCRCFHDPATKPTVWAPLCKRTRLFTDPCDTQHGRPEIPVINCPRLCLADDRDPPERELLRILHFHGNGGGQLALFWCAFRAGPTNYANKQKKLPRRRADASAYVNGAIRYRLVRFARSETVLFSRSGVPQGRK